MRDLADAALKTAKDGGASYADIRINRYRTQAVFAREDHLQQAETDERFGFGVRVLVDGVWGFAASSRVTKDNVVAITAQALSTAKANQALSTDRVELVPVPRVIDTWQTPITKDPFRIPLATKVDLLLSMNAIAMKAGADYVNSGSSRSKKTSTSRRLKVQKFRSCSSAFGRCAVSRSSTKPLVASMNATCSPRPPAPAGNTSKTTHCSTKRSSPLNRRGRSSRPRA